MIERKKNILDMIGKASLDRNNFGLVDERDFWDEIEANNLKMTTTNISFINSFVVNSEELLDYRKLDGDIRTLVEDSKKDGNDKGSKATSAGLGKRKKAKKLKKEEV